MKQCTACGELKPFAAFDTSGARLRSQCRTCRTKANTERVRRKALEHAALVEPPEWSVLGPHYPHTADGLLVPVDRLTEAQCQQVRELNVLRHAAGVWEINLSEK